MTGPNRAVTRTAESLALLLDLEPDLEVVANVRRRAVANLEAAGVPPGVLQDVAVVLSELLTNAVEAGSAAAIGLEVGVGPGQVWVSVTNSLVDAGVPPRHEWGPDDVLAHRGRGLAIVEGMADEVMVEQAGHAVTVRAILPIGSTGDGA